jgi:hypothetical protein
MCTGNVNFLGEMLLLTIDSSNFEFLSDLKEKNVNISSLAKVLFFAMKA